MVSGHLLLKDGSPIHYEGEEKSSSQMSPLGTTNYRHPLEYFSVLFFLYFQLFLNDDEWIQEKNEKN